MSPACVVIIGRPNVGKSTLFNRLTKSRRDGALVADQPGVTRDRIYGWVEVSSSRGFTLVDTGGFETKGFMYQPFSENLVWQQTVEAIDQSDLVLLLCDAREGVHPHDRELIARLRKMNKRFLCLANKIDGLEHTDLSHAFFAMGVDEVHPLSAAHGFGASQVLGQIADILGPRLQSTPTIDSESRRCLSLIGRPNAGKSSILNRLLGEERSLVSDIAGTTRDHIDTHFRFCEKDYTLIDTAGIRRRTKVRGNVEVASVMASLRCIERSDLVIYVIAADEGIADQDARLINRAIERKKPVLIVVNKWDLIPDKTSLSMKKYEEELRLTIPECRVHFSSCLQNQRVHKILDVAEELIEQNRQRVGTARVNEALETLTRHHPHPLSGTRNVKFFYASQLKSSPPTFVIMCNRAQNVLPSYKRYLTKGLRRTLGFDKVPIHLLFKNKRTNTLPRLSG